MSMSTVRKTFVTIAGASVLALGGAGVALATGDQPAEGQNPGWSETKPGNPADRPDCVEIVKNDGGIVVVAPADCDQPGARPFEPAKPAKPAEK